MSWLDVEDDGFGFLVVVRWLLKPPERLATHTQEPKVNVMPSLSMALVKLNDAIEFAW
jgi:hypothetical protein